ncbi:M20/M25/M40 family metallo-hydrolase [Thalassomonas haliotis]|uniref:M20/M25/M40 family metallo-hydrolase n=1 Tax=Thalassomonas haliotis TaxID=485448 RepID=A0ABY7VF99_9GAMM|nr:M20/M25/M40 family metallo-hydrolase [Thalassomonas haliotis]WDE11814.1 M20/M25/M40 family metallo-hydrolase [Thalassomonas haliotis]
MKSFILRHLLILFLIIPTKALADSSDSEILTSEKISQIQEKIKDEAIQSFRSLLTLPNDANKPDDILALLDWLEPEFAASGFVTKRIKTKGSPILYAEQKVINAKGTVLIYLQADGQPVDPSAWHQENPYKPSLKVDTGNNNWEEVQWSALKAGLNSDFRIFSRSASDSKGPIAQFIYGIRALNSYGWQRDFNLKVLVDTEEELGSPNLAKAVLENKSLLASDMLMVFDGPPHISNLPTLNFGARGVMTLSLKVYGPKKPQHSGHMGNFVPNPAFKLSTLLASMKTLDGKVLIDGFYDGVVISTELKKQLAKIPDDLDKLKLDMGFAEPEHVAGSLQESIQYPSLNIRGLSSAWTGKQVRTIIPDSAVAEIDIRLVETSKPEALISSIKKHIEAEGFYITSGEPSKAERSKYPHIVELNHQLGYKAFRTDFDSHIGVMLRKALVRLNGTPPLLISTLGGSVPISPLVNILDIPAVLVPTVNMDNNQHSPNENIRLDSFLNGLEVVLAVFSEPFPN